MSSWLDRTPPERIEAGTVRLRRWRVEDAAVLMALVGENVDHLRPWMAWAREAPASADEQASFLRHVEHGWGERTDFGYAVTLPGGEPIGGMGLHIRAGAGTLEIGYWIAAAHTGRGHATACARVLTDAAFALPGVERVEIRCDEANVRSAAVPRRLGFRLVEIVSRDAVAPAETGRGMIWVAERGDWPPRG